MFARIILIGLLASPCAFARTESRAERIERKLDELQRELKSQKETQRLERQSVINYESCHDRCNEKYDRPDDQTPWDQTPLGACHKSCDKIKPVGLGIGYEC